MPTTETTWRDQTLLHVVFGVSSIVLLLSTIWMFAADHQREWKHYQKNHRRIATKLTQFSQLQFKTDEAARERESLEKKLAVATLEPLDAGLVKEFKAEAEKFQDGDERLFAATNFDSITELRDKLVQELGGLNEGDDENREKKQSALALRQELFSRLGEIIQGVETREHKYLQNRKFTAADFDAAKGELGLAHRDHRPEEMLAGLQEKVDSVSGELTEATLKYEDISLFRNKLQRLFDKLKQPETDANLALDDNRSQLERLEAAYEEESASFFSSKFPFIGSRWLELPILNAFNSPLSIQQVWLPRLKQENGSFAPVARFDRCITCHQGLDSALPGQLDKAGYLAAREVTLELSTPDSDPTRAGDGLGEVPETMDIYGLKLVSADEGGLVHANDVTVSFVQPQSRAAQATVAEQDGADAVELSGTDLKQQAALSKDVVTPADDQGFRVGDVLLSINDNKIVEHQQAERFLMDHRKWGQPLRITVRRGLPHPYASHPRLDLFVGSTSPHQMQDFGCTICHEGQGSATSFKWASHSPDNEKQRSEWGDEHGWFNNHHWIFPMFPQRFREASCVKCHHEVVELKPSERFNEAPAPTVTAGYDLIRNYGCFACHEISGYAGPDKRIGPDMRLEPNYFAAALQLVSQLPEREDHFNRLKAEKSDSPEDLNQIVQRLSDLARMHQLAGRVVQAQDDETDARQRLVEMINADVQRGVEDGGEEDSAGPTLGSASHSLIRVLKDVEVPGTYRKPGPSLRYVAKKLDREFLYDWLRDPRHFRPDTKMPRFFGQWSHLEGGDRELAEKYEPIEILGVLTYLMERSQAFDYIAPAEGITPSSPEDKVARGKLLFETRGCLACHSHKDFPAAHAAHDESPLGQMVHGPDLSAIGDKLAAPRNSRGANWLYSWIRNPSHYHARTRMPNTFLTPISAADGTVTDPAEDITAYLLSSRSDWHPQDPRLVPDLANLDGLTRELLENTFTRSEAKRYLSEGIPESMGSELKGAEVELVGAAGEKEKLLYVGSKAIAKYGCFGCHDIPGFEDAKPIGTGLADWGRKETSKLDFGHILNYLEHGGHSHGGDAHQDQAHHQHEHSQEAVPPLDPFYQRGIQEHERHGFIYQKLRQPRSYDFEKTANIRYIERLRMPEFPLTHEQREAVITFVLGLVAQPPAEKYIYEPNERSAAIMAGNQVLEKYNCAGCHVLEPEKWQVAVRGLQDRSDDLEGDNLYEPGSLITFPMINYHVSPEQQAQSENVDRRGRRHATLVGTPAISAADGLPEIFDQEGDLVEPGDSYDSRSVRYRFELWEPAVIDGKLFNVGAGAIEVPDRVIQRKISANGGQFARYLLPRAVQLEKQVNPSANGTEAWGWVPPPLMGQGNKVQTGWLHDFLMDPHPIRPAVLLRMPKFNLSSKEASHLVNYFAAMSNADYPYDFEYRKRSDYLVEADNAYRDRLRQLNVDPAAPAGVRLNHAMQIVTGNDYCIKCHIVGDSQAGGFRPEGSERAMAPDLSKVFQRLRSDYVLEWIGNPKQVFPYTAMPVNIKYDPLLDYQGGVSQELYHGTSVEQLQAVVDLLMNYDTYTNRRSPIGPLIKPKAVPEAANIPSTDGVVGN